MSDFQTATRQLAETLIGIFPDLTFSKAPDTAVVTIVAGGLQLVVAPIPAAPEAPEPLDEEVAPYATDDRQEQATEATIRADQALNFLTIPVGELSELQIVSLQRQIMKLRPAALQTDPDSPESRQLDALKERWSAELKAHRGRSAQQPQQTPITADAATVYPNQNGRD